MNIKTKINERIKIKETIQTKDKNNSGVVCNNYKIIILIKIFIISVFSLFLIQNAFAGEIINNKIKILDYGDKDESIRKDMNSGIISLKGNVVKSKIECDNDYCFLILNERKVLYGLLNTKIRITIYKDGKKLKTFPYPLPFDISPLLSKSIYYKNGIFDTSNSFLYKRIQGKALSCESSATADILSSLLNTKYDEDYVISLMDKDYYNKRPTLINRRRVWGNPNNGFVGYINYLPSGIKARQDNYTGYGVLEKPIAKIYNKLGFETKIITNENYNSDYNEKEHMKELLTELVLGNKVQLWGDYCTDPSEEDGKNLKSSLGNKNSCQLWNKNRKLTWLYKEGDKYKEYVGLSGEHAFYLLGFEGTIDNPLKIIVWDTNTGKHSYSYTEWKRKWNLMQNRSIIIYKKQ